jgi:hypothetical protein
MKGTRHLPRSQFLIAFLARKIYYSEVTGSTALCIEIKRPAEMDRTPLSYDRGGRTLASIDRRKNLAFLCLLLFVLTIGAVAFHHHDDCDHDDCPICVAASAISTAGFSLFIFAVYILTVFLETPLGPSGYNCPICDLPPARAPPA